MMRFFTIFVLAFILILLFGGFAFSAEPRFRAESSGIAGLILLTDFETGCKYLASKKPGTQSYFDIQPVLLPDGRPDCRRK